MPAVYLISVRLLEKKISSDSMKSWLLFSSNWMFLIGEVSEVKFYFGDFYANFHFDFIFGSVTANGLFCVREAWNMIFFATFFQYFDLKIDSVSCHVSRYFLFVSHFFIADTRYLLCMFSYSVNLKKSMAARKLVIFQLNYYMSLCSNCELIPLESF